MKFKKGVRVLYIPTYAYGDINHKDCESGVVSSVNDKFVFVKFDCIWGNFKNTTGDEDITAQSCNPEDLITEDEAKFINNV